MKRFAALLCILALVACQKDPAPTPVLASTSQPTKFDAVREAALKGDYQTQRNVAYGYSTSPYPGQDKNPTLACAWRIVIIKSGNEKVDATDVSNHKVYCDSLGKTERQVAEAQAAKLLQKELR